MKHSRTLRPAALTLVVAATALLLAACGSSSNTGSSSSTSSGAAVASAGGASSAARSKFAACLKAHGVTLPARPAGARRRPGGQGYGRGGGGGFFFGGGGGRGTGGSGPGAGRFDNPKFRAALQACGGGRFPQRRFIPNKAAVAKFTACVKQHGYNLPAANFSGKGPIFPAAIARDKKFQAAARACASDLRPSGAGAPPGSGAGGGGSGSRSSSD
jgi:hypothetical protein